MECPVSRFRLESSTGRLRILSYVGAQSNTQRIQTARVHKQSVCVPVTMWVGRMDKMYKTTAQGVPISDGRTTTWERAARQKGVRSSVSQ